MKQNNIYVADFETIIDTTKYYKKHKRSGIVYGYLENFVEPTKNFEFINIQDMFWYLTNQHKSDVLVFFHNLSFDGVFILDWLGKNGYTISDNLESEGHITVFRTTGSKIYSIEVAYKPRSCRKIRKIIFQCSLMILQSPVELLGRNVNLSKFEKEEKENPKFYCREPEASLSAFYAKNKDYCEYCKRDVRIVIASLKEFYNAIIAFLKEEEFEDKKIKQLYQRKTISSISLFLQCCMIEKQGLDVKSIFMKYPQDRVIMDQFTNGGLTLNNEDYRSLTLKNIKGNTIDLKSAYPAVMSGLLPYGDIKYEKPIDYQHKHKWCCFQEIKYKRIWPKNHNIPLLKNWSHKGDNYFLQAENYTTYLLEDEAEVLEQLYNYEGKEIINQYWFELKDYLNRFIYKMYYHKENYKKLGELGKSHTFKIIMNSGYGIHAKRDDFKIVVPFQAEDIIERKEVEYNICNHIDLNKIDRHSYVPNNPLYAYAPNLSKGYGTLSISHKGIANYITSQTRIKIMKGILHFGPKHFLYCDTDSLFLMNVPQEKIDAYCGVNLGDWEEEVEKRFDECAFLRPKFYQTKKDEKVVKTGSAGLRKQNLPFDEIFDAELKAVLFKEAQREYIVKNASKVPLRVDGGLILVDINKKITLSQYSDLNKMTPERKKYVEELVKKVLERYNDRKKS